ncbi:50S ribosomal protein L9 [Tepiditoga spiralis]|uniref:Large ribosomal subunit protein bL9 n=1 Tax=Tepiditoga spiralis TaxID=2108365 RepID=A0A7G1GAT4_9BACT|nr:50S ribosomal protein L9 [Tepiditoga spiralis]BBE31352.1 50S ribosomal protein L9 [Tepiditoga spiralis]
MKVLLKKDVAKIGKKGEIINVSDGYGRNFLIPKGYAVIAGEGELKHFNTLKKNEEKKKKNIKIKNEKLVETIEKNTYVIKVNSGENGKLFGAVTAADVAKRIEEISKVKFDKKWFDEKINIKEIGKFKFKIKLSQGVRGFVVVDIVPIDKK